MAWGEACRMLQILMADTASHLAAAVSGWLYPVDRTTLMLMDLYDLQHMSKSKKKPKPYPRPWPSERKSTTKPGDDVTQDQVVAALRFAGHMGELPAA